MDLSLPTLSSGSCRLISDVELAACEKDRPSLHAGHYVELHMDGAVQSQAS
jgi:hypothetical protein